MDGHFREEANFSEDTHGQSFLKGRLLAVILVRTLLDAHGRSWNLILVRLVIDGYGR